MKLRRANLEVKSLAEHFQTDFSKSCSVMKGPVQKGTRHNMFTSSHLCKASQKEFGARQHLSRAMQNGKKAFGIVNARFKAIFKGIQNSFTARVRTESHHAKALLPET